MPAVDPPLAGLRVTELAQGVTGPFCGKLSAELGAQVLKGQPISGDTARPQRPFAQDDPDPEGSRFCLYRNTAKGSITLRRGSRANGRIFERSTRASS